MPTSRNNCPGRRCGSLEVGRVCTSLLKAYYVRFVVCHFVNRLLKGAVRDSGKSHTPGWQIPTFVFLGKSYLAYLFKLSFFIHCHFSCAQLGMTLWTPLTRGSLEVYNSFLQDSKDTQFLESDQRIWVLSSQAPFGTDINIFSMYKHVVRPCLFEKNSLLVPDSIQPLQGFY